MSDARSTAEKILDSIGGKENIAFIEHCATRLRLTLRDDTQYDAAAIEATDGVKGRFYAAGQHQIILGTGFVNKVYDAISGGPEERATDIQPSLNTNIFQKASRALGDVFVPIIPTLVATGLFMGLRGLLINLGIRLDPSLLALTQVLTDTAFAFLPALVMYSVMRKFGGSPILGIVIGLMLVAPQLPSANAIANGSARPLFFSIAGLSIPVLGYQGSVLPALIVGIFAAWVEKSLKKIVPDVLDLVLTSFLTLLISLICGLFVLGPIMHEVEFLLLMGARCLLTLPFCIGGFVTGALWQVVVLSGLHHAFKTLEIELLAHGGTNPVNVLASGSIVAQSAAAIAVALKIRNKSKKTLYLSSIVPGFLGITEPLLFGINVPRLTPFLFGCLGGGCAGAFSSFFGIAGTGMSITVIPGMLLYLNGQLLLYIAANTIGFIVAFVLTAFFYKTED